MSRCFWCHEDVSRTALVDLVWTQEPFVIDDDLEMRELREVVWHKACYLSACGPTPIGVDAASPDTADGNAIPAAQFNSDC
jgi:hypothetical protein